MLLQTNNTTLLDHSFFQHPTPVVAKALLGKKIIRVVDGNITLSGIICETEAYGAHDDPASHAYKKRTKRNNAMFGPVGHSYIYFTYGMHHCLNIVARDNDAPAGAVLIRSIVPLDGISYMKDIRKTNLANLTNGPGKIAQVFALTRDHNHIDLTKQGILYLEEGITVPSKEISYTPRIGIRTAQDKLWRFVWKKRI